MKNKNEIVGSGSGYYKHMDADIYRENITSPSRNREYLRRFLRPIIQHAKNRFGSPIRVLDIACGPADELDFIKHDPDIQIIATDISPDILPYVKAEIGRDVIVFASDSNFPAFKDGIAEAGILINAVIYVPDKMLEAMYRGLKPGGQCTVNFSVFNKESYDTFLRRKGEILDRELSVLTRNGQKNFNVKILETRELTKADGTPNLAMQHVGQQILFQSIDDVKELIKLTGFIEVEHSRFKFPSFSNLNNLIDVFILEKPLQ